MLSTICTRSDCNLPATDFGFRFRSRAVTRSICNKETKMIRSSQYARAHRAVTNRAAAILGTGVIVALFAVGAVFFPTPQTGGPSGYQPAHGSVLPKRTVSIIPAASPTIRVARHMR